MQCVVCGGADSNSLETCPHCQTTQDALADALPRSPEEESMPTSTSQERKTKTSSGAGAEAKGATTANATSTLIEFPGVPPKPQWRKELSERVREIQQRRALEAARDSEADATQSGHISSGMIDDPTADVAAEAAASPLGLVPPPPEAPQPNPLVVAALKRIARARQANPLPPMGRASRGGAAAAAVAHVVEENYQPALDAPALVVPDHAAAPNAQTAQAASVDKLERSAEATRPAPLAIVPPTAASPAAKTIEETATRTAQETRARRHIPVVADEAALSQIEAEMHAAVLSNHSLAPESAPTDDHAPVAKRIASGIIDLLVVAFASTPFAAIIELTNGNWSDARVAASMGGIVIVLMFLYLMTATALAGRTWGMSLVSLRTVDAETGMAPTTGQCIRRAFGYMLSLATLGLGLLYALFDAEGRAAHDHLSGTIVIAD
jgi:uncharacterized RDD family membrane protein YckC